MVTQNRFRLLAQAIFAGATFPNRPEVAAGIETDTDDQVKQRGKFTKSAVGYISAAPPPFFYQYNCSECRLWQGEQSQDQGVSTCRWVEGSIAANGFCVRWLPTNNAGKPFSWLRNPRAVGRRVFFGIRNIISDPLTRK